jgi:D-alanyl-D-alanine carboxypeptidase
MLIMRYFMFIDKRPITGITPEHPMILFDPITITQALHAGTDALRATANAPATLFQIDRGPLSVAVAAGVSDLETGTPADAGQTFEIGSQTKLMTAVTILQLVEQDKIALDAPAATYLSPATINGIANTDTVTVRQLLNMTSGIDNYTEVRDADGIPLFVKALLESPARHQRAGGRILLYQHELPAVGPDRRTADGQGILRRPEGGHF